MLIFAEIISRYAKTNIYTNKNVKKLNIELNSPFVCLEIEILKKVNDWLIPITIFTIIHPITTVKASISSFQILKKTFYIFYMEYTVSFSKYYIFNYYLFFLTQIGKHIYDNFFKQIDLILMD